MKQDGAILVDGQEVAETVRCCHCGVHYVIRKGSGIRRGFCLKCMHRTCGSMKCVDCVPFEKRLDAFEKGGTNGVL